MPIHSSRVAYGINSYYVQQGQGRKLERRAPEGAPEGIQAPMEMQVALGRDGTAVLKGYRWNPIGIEVSIRKNKASEVAGLTASGVGRKWAPKIVNVKLCNVSTLPLAVVLPPDLRTIHIQESENWSSSGVDVGVLRTSLPPLTDADVRVLKPGETATAEIDPSQAEWFVSSKPGDEPLPIGRKGTLNGAFRFVYVPPSPETCQGLKEAARIVHSPLAGRQFSSCEFKEE